MKLLITCPFGLGSLLAQELKKLGFLPQQTFQTGTFVITDNEGMMRINYHSRLANKVYIELISGEARTFDQLFEIMTRSSYNQFLSNTNISLKVETKASVLSSKKSIQSVAHKAILSSLFHFGKKESYIEELLLVNNHNCVSLFLNTSGAPLYQRGYKKNGGEAPIKENLAIALLLLSGWNFKFPLYDPFCGSGTIAIEAALFARNIAPGSWRHFNFEYFKNYEPSRFNAIRINAKKNEFSGTYNIYASDLSQDAVQIAQQNANYAGISGDICFEVKDFFKLSIPSTKKSWIVCNPPYGKRITSPLLSKIYKVLQNYFTNNIYGGRISSITQNHLDNKNRSQKKLFNGATECLFNWRKFN